MIGAIFSPIERDTPDTSDHSQDEGFQKAEIKLSRPKDLANGNIDENESPASELTLEELLKNEELSTIELLEKSKLTLEKLIRASHEYLKSDNWRWRFLCFISCMNSFENKAPIQVQRMLHLKAQTIPAVERYRESMPKHLKNGWTYDELDLLHRLSFTDLTRDSIAKSLPTHQPKEIFDILTYLRYRIPWTDPELKFVKLSKQDERLAMHNLPLRSKKAIERHYEEYFGKPVDNEAATTNKSTFKAPNSHKITKPNTEKSKVLNQKKIEESSDEEEEQEETNEDDEEGFPGDDLNYCIQTDLTLETLEDIFPNHSIEEIVSEIKKNADTETIPLTKGEKISMKKYLKEQVPVESILHHYPCRSEEFVKTKYKEFEFNANRKTNFKNPTEKLVYEAQWSAYLSVGGASGRSSRRVSAKPKVDLEKVLQEAAQIKKAPVVELTEEEKFRREEKAALIRQRQLANLARRKEIAEERKRVFEERKALGLIKQRPKDEMSASLKAVLDGSMHFQSVIGDKKKVEEGQKRKRVQAEHFQPEFIKRPKLVTRAREQEKLKLKQAKKLSTTGKKKRERQHKTSEDSGVFANELTEDTADEEEEEEEEEVSPFDPTNICTDTLVPLKDRKLFVDGFYGDAASIPKLNFKNSGDHTVMMEENTSILFDDNIASHIITSYKKNYRSLPVSFPPLFSNTGELNDKNVLKVRFLIYPQHCELFVLAEPKSNELDPIYEIVKLMMIHYTLYFSHSESIKETIMEYCETLEAAVENNSFSDFMFVIDKWNMLMLELSPNVEEVSRIREEIYDINKEIREEYLSSFEVKQPTVDDLNLELFYSTISQEESSPAFNTLVIGAQPAKSEGEETSSQIIEPTNVSNNLKYIKPDDYNSSFFGRLQLKSDISRFAMHQILLRVYSRVVSTDSRKLRSYKAFTAEVYGELLPSFTSEVLEKVKLAPNQKFYDLGSGVGNTTFQAALEFGAQVSGGCEIMEHASKLCKSQEHLMRKHLSVFGLKELNLDFALLQSFVDNETVRQNVLNCDVLIINNYLFDANLNNEVGRLLFGLRTGTKIISLRNFIRPRYKANGDSIFDRLSVEKHEMSDFLSVSWTANKVPYYISTVEENILPEYLNRDQTPDGYSSGSLTPVVKAEREQLAVRSDLPILTPKNNATGSSQFRDDTGGLTPIGVIEESLNFQALNVGFVGDDFSILGETN